MSELEMHEAGAEAMAAGPGLEKVEETEEHWDAAISRSIDAKREAEESLLQSLRYVGCGISKWSSKPSERRA